MMKHRLSIIPLAHRRILIFLMLAVVGVSAGVKAAPDQCWIAGVGAASEQCDSNKNLYVDVATGTLTAVNNIASGTVAVKDGYGGTGVLTRAVDLDIRNLTAASDTVTVTATALDTRQLTAASDTVTITGTVSATALDIRQLTAASDTVTVSGAVTTSGTVTATPLYTSTFTYATATVAASTVGLFTAPATATSMLILNESSTQTVRFCVGCAATDLQTTCTLATSSGVALVAGASFAMDGVSVNSVYYCNPAGGTADISIQWGAKP